MVIVTPLSNYSIVVITYFLIRVKLYERHPHTSGLHKSKYCVMPDVSQRSSLVKARATTDTSKKTGISEILRGAASHQNLCTKMHLLEHPHYKKKLILQQNMLFIVIL